MVDCDPPEWQEGDLHEPEYNLRALYDRSSCLEWLANREDRAEHPFLSNEATRAAILGVTAKAVRDYVQGKACRGGRLKQYSEDAERWLFKNGVDPTEEPFLGSFAWVCMILDKDVKKARAIIKSMRVEDLPKVDRNKDASG